MDLGTCIGSRVKNAPTGRCAAHSTRCHPVQQHRLTHLMARHTADDQLKSMRSVGALQWVAFEQHLNSGSTPTSTPSVSRRNTPNDGESLFHMVFTRHPPRSTRASNDSGRYLWEFSVCMTSPSVNLIVRLPIRAV